MITHKNLFSWLSKFKPGTEFKYVDKERWYRASSLPYQGCFGGYVVDCYDVAPSRGWMITDYRLYPRKDIIFKKDA